MRFVKPLDTALLKELSKTTKTWVTVEENMVAGGFGSGVVEWLSHEGLFDVNVKLIGIDDHFVDHGTQDILRAREGLDADGIFNATKLFCRSQVPAQQSDTTDHRVTNIKDYLSTPKT